MSEKQHPFQTGTEVVIELSGWANSYRKAVVDKVRKDGKFTLVGSPKEQWRASNGRYGEDGWQASRAGEAYYRGGTLYLPDHPGLVERRREAECERRWRDTQSRIEKLKFRDVTAAMMAAIEAALAMKTESKP